jgi:hypothetical protein
MRVVRKNPAPPNLENPIDLYVYRGLVVTYRDEDGCSRQFGLGADQARTLAYLLEQGADQLDGRVVRQDDREYEIEVPE